MAWRVLRELVHESGPWSPLSESPLDPPFPILPPGRIQALVSRPVLGTRYCSDERGLFFHLKTFLLGNMCCMKKLYVENIVAVNVTSQSLLVVLLNLLLNDML